MVNLANKQMERIANIYHLIGDKLMLSTFVRPLPLERFELEFVKNGKIASEIDREIKGWMKIAVALNLWRDAHRFKFTEEEHKNTLTRLICLSAGHKLIPEYKKEEVELLDYLALYMGDDEETR